MGALNALAFQGIFSGCTICVCVSVMKLCSLIQGVRTLQSQYYEEHENLPTSGGEISVSAQRIVSGEMKKHTAAAGWIWWPIVWPDFSDYH